MSKYTKDEINKFFEQRSKDLKIVKETLEDLIESYNLNYGEFCGLTEELKYEFYRAYWDQDEE